jgi:hypothetical protein
MPEDGPSSNLDYKLSSKRPNSLAWKSPTPDVVPAQGTLLSPLHPDSCEGFLGLVLTSSVATGNKYQHKHEEVGLHVDDPLRATKGVQ